MTAISFADPIICWPWYLRMQGPDSYCHGANCTVCRRDVAAPKNAARPMCLYCGLARGIVPEEEIDDTNPEHLARSPWVRVSEYVEVKP